jgi:ABC-type transporter Mla MlaB component
VVLRITEQGESGSWVVLRLEGRLVAEMALLLESECAALLETRDEVNLDLAGVGFVDLNGIEVLQRLSRAGAVIFCPPGPVASVLEGAGVPVRPDATA